MRTRQLNLRNLMTFGLLAVAVGLMIFMSQDWTDGHSPADTPTARTAMPDLVLPRLGGGGVWRLSDHRGQVVLVNFWATWCSPCQQETPGLVRLAQRYSARGLVIAAIALDERGPDTVRSFVRQFHVPYTILVPSPGSPYASGIESLPTSILIDPSGRIAKTYVGAVREATFAKDVEQLLAENSVHKTETTA